MKEKHITITDAQDKYVTDKDINLSRFVQRRLDEHKKRDDLTRRWNINDSEEEDLNKKSLL